MTQAYTTKTTILIAENVVSKKRIYSRMMKKLAAAIEVPYPTAKQDLRELIGGKESVVRQVGSDVWKIWFEPIL